MPKKKKVESPEDQFKRFHKAVKDLEDAGELSPEAEDRFERAMGCVTNAPSPPTRSDQEDKESSEG